MPKNIYRMSIPEMVKRGWTLFNDAKIPGRLGIRSVISDWNELTWAQQLTIAPNTVSMKTAYWKLAYQRLTAPAQKPSAIFIATGSLINMSHRMEQCPVQTIVYGIFWSNAGWTWPTGVMTILPWYTLARTVR